MKIAFATSDGVHVDQQLRRASRLDVYEVGPRGLRLDRTFTFPPDRSVKTDERLEAIRGAAIVFGTAFGPSSAARVASRVLRTPGRGDAGQAARFARFSANSLVSSRSCLSTKYWNRVSSEAALMKMLGCSTETVHRKMHASAEVGISLISHVTLG